MSKAKQKEQLLRPPKFYKLFGYPTGVGALVARRKALAKLKRGYFGGGTVQFASVQNRLARLQRGAFAPLQ